MTDRTKLDIFAARNFGIPKKFQASSFDNYIGDIKSLPDSCYLHGKAGTGKTHLAISKMKQLLKDVPKLSGSEHRAWMSGETDQEREKNLLFFSVPSLLSRIRATFDPNNGESEREVMKILQTCDYLVLDDMGAEKTTDFVRSCFYQIIDYRYSWERATIITGNLNIAELADRFDDRLASRIAGMCEVIEITGKDRRVS